MRRPVALGLAITVALVALAWASGGPFSGDGAQAVTSSTTIRWGPYVVPAASGGVPGAIDNQIFVDLQKACTDCYITRVVPNLVYGENSSHPDGTAVNFSTGGMMHHMVLFNLNGTDATCDGTLLGSLGERILASGNERTVIDLPDGYGYYVDPADSWAQIMHLMNMQPTAQEMYLEFTFEYRPGSDPVNPVTPIWLDVDNCNDSEYAVPAAYSDTHWDWTSDREGNIVAMAGHVHNYGFSIAAENLEQGEYFCTSVAGYATGSSYPPASVTPGDEAHPGAANVIDPGDPGYVGRIEDMTPCAPWFHVYTGDTIRLHTQYSPPSAQDDVMGIMIAYMHETLALPDYDGDGLPDEIDADDDNDGFADTTEEYVGTDPMDECPNSDTMFDEPDDRWTLDFDDDQDADILDLTYYITPDRHFDTDVGTFPGDVRFDISPGPGFPGSTDIDIVDLTVFISIKPPMFGGTERAFGLNCIDDVVP